MGTPKLAGIEASSKIRESNGHQDVLHEPYNIAANQYGQAGRQFVVLMLMKRRCCLDRCPGDKRVMRAIDSPVGKGRPVAKWITFPGWSWYEVTNWLPDHISHKQVHNSRYLCVEELNTKFDF